MAKETKPHSLETVIAYMAGSNTHVEKKEFLKEYVKSHTDAALVKAEAKVASCVTSVSEYVEDGWNVDAKPILKVYHTNNIR